MDPTIQPGLLTALSQDDPMPKPKRSNPPKDQPQSARLPFGLGFALGDDRVASSSSASQPNQLASELPETPDAKLKRKAKLRGPEFPDPLSETDQNSDRPLVDPDIEVDPAIEAHPAPDLQPPSRNPNFIDLTLDSPPLSTQKRQTTSTQLRRQVKRLKETPKESASQAVIEVSDSPAGTSTTKVIPPPGLDLDEEFACPICCDLFVAPVNLACGHSFCGSCAHDWLKKESVCPSCRQEVNGPPARIYVLETIIEKYFDHQLDLLRREDKLSEALAMKLEREEKVTQWTDRRALVQSAARRMAAERPTLLGHDLPRHPLHLPRIVGIDAPYGLVPAPELAQLYPQRLPAPPALENRFHRHILHPNGSSSTAHTPRHARGSTTPAAGSSFVTDTSARVPITTAQHAHPRAGPSAFSRPRSRYISRQD